MDAIDRFGQELVGAGRRRQPARWPLPALFRTRFARTSPRRRAIAHVRIALVVLALVLASAAITLAATGVILTGSPVATVRAPIATAGEGIPVAGGARLLPLRAPDPAGGLPWGMRIVHTTRGLICVQVGRVYDGQLGELGVDEAFHNDGRFHPLPTDALPEVLANAGGWIGGNCSSPGDIYAGDSVGLELNAATSPSQGAGVPADRREIPSGCSGCTRSASPTAKARGHELSQYSRVWARISSCSATGAAGRWEASARLTAETNRATTADRPLRTGR